MTTTYGLAWDIRRAEYWAGRKHRCHRCGRRWPSKADRCPDGSFEQYPVHHVYGAGRRFALGEEPSWALVGLCPPCHDLIHAGHRNMARRRRWMVGARVVNPHDYYRTLATFTWRHVYLGRAFAWRDGFPFMGRLPAWQLPPREWR